MSTPPVAPPADGQQAVRSDLRSLDKVRGIFASLAKFVNAQAIYQTNNPHFIKTAQAFDQSFRTYFETEAELVLTVSQYQLLWREQTVYDIGCNTESIAFLLFKDGIGEISIQSGVSRAELEQFTGILKGALYNPSAQFDTASALWQAEFPNIFYRVLDEQTDSGGGDGDGTGNANREQPLRANDHQDLAAAEDSPRHRSDAALVTLGAHFDALVEGEQAADAATREAHLQRAIAAHVDIQAHELDAWGAAPRSGHEGDELIAFLRVMLDFTHMRSTPAVARDVLDTIERLTHYIRDEGNVATLTATLELIGEADGATLEPGFATLLDRVEHDFTAPDYLVALARGLRAGNTPEELVRYLNLAGESAVAGLCELLARTSDEAIHEKCCDVLHYVAGNNLLAIVDQLEVANPLIAADVVRLLNRSASGVAIPAVVQRILSAQDAGIRRCAIDYLVQNGSDEAARLMCGLFKDENQAVRVRTFAALERVKNPLVVNELTSLCFAEQTALKNAEELEFMFRALGKIAGIAVLPRLRQTVEKKHLLPSAKARSKRDKILALTALRYIPGEEARGVIERLSHDSDQLVKTKAQHVLKSLKQGLGSDLYDRLDGSSPSPGTSKGTS